MPQVAQVVDPLEFKKVCWPHINFYDKQVDIIYSVHEEAYETVVPAGNMLGKDFVAAYIALWFFLTRSPVHVITTSADYPQLEAVLWGEIRRFIQTSAVPLTHDQGGPLLVNHMHVRKMIARPDPKSGLILPNTPLTEMCGLSYLTARVSAKGEGMQGHHIPNVGDGIPRTLLIVDEASGVEDIAYSRSTEWAERILVIGNCHPCDNFFRRAVKGGDIPIEQATKRTRVQTR